ncbi:MAG: hypothetical protein LBT84_06220 [Spirochaetia bacterium]|jgi:hypothetical protein|nr:hypothetical protein [Spirochaetia bacterium]
MANNEIHKLGEFLIENQIINKEQLLEALTLQKDNPERLIGHILVTMGIVTKEQLIMAFEMYLVTTGLSATHADEWLDQDEIDTIMNKLK